MRVLTIEQDLLRHPLEKNLLLNYFSNTLACFLHTAVKGKIGSNQPKYTYIRNRTFIRRYELQRKSTYNIRSMIVMWMNNMKKTLAKPFKK